MLSTSGHAEWRISSMVVIGDAGPQLPTTIRPVGRHTRSSSAAHATGSGANCTPRPR
ncbi:hypothetical protein SMICM304S_08738 [Streptomyces microflavus]